jgi:hypothetical protein
MANTFAGYQRGGTLGGDKLMYLPYPGDEIDLMVSDYLNQKLDMDGLSVMFVRMSEGVY